MLPFSLHSVSSPVPSLQLSFSAQVLSSVYLQLSVSFVLFAATSVLVPVFVTLLLQLFFSLLSASNIAMDSALVSTRSPFDFICFDDRRVELNLG